MRSNLLYLTMIAALGGTTYLVANNQTDAQLLELVGLKSADNQTIKTIEEVKEEAKAAAAERVAKVNAYQPPTIEKPIDFALDNMTIVESERKAPEDPSMLTESFEQQFEAFKIGQTREQVEAEFGKPAVVTNDGDHWTYGDRVLIFRDDAVAGWLDLDEQAAELHRVAVVSGNIGQHQPEVDFAWRFVEMDETLDARSRRNDERRFSLRDRLMASRSKSRNSFRHPDFLRAFGQTLDRNRQASKDARRDSRSNQTRSHSQRLRGQNAR